MKAFSPGRRAITVKVFMVRSPLFWLLFCIFKYNKISKKVNQKSGRSLHHQLMGFRIKELHLQNLSLMKDVVFKAIDGRLGQFAEAKLVPDREEPGLGVVPVDILHTQAFLNQVHLAVEVVHHVHAGGPFDGNPGNQGDGGGGAGGGGEAVFHGKLLS